MKILPSARKHGVTNRSINHAFAHLLVRFDMGDDDPPVRDLVLGPDVAGNIIELIVVVLDNGDELAIHAMPIRSRYLYLLPSAGDAHA
jgi:hypothetical protein